MKQFAVTLALLFIIAFSPLHAQLEAENNIIGFVNVPSNAENTNPENTIKTVSEKKLNVSSQNLVNVAPTRIYNFAQVTLTLPEKGKVNIAIHDLTGKKVKNITSETLEKGKHQKTIQVKGLSNGVYHVTLTMDGYTEKKKIIIAR